MIYYDWLSRSPVGGVLIGVSAKGLCAVLISKSRAAGLREISRMFPEKELSRNSFKVRKYKNALTDYFAGHNSKFKIPLDLTNVDSRFRRKILSECRKIPFGKTVSYGTLAGRAGSPKAARAAGGALGSNPMPIVIPCHRVVQASGAMGGFSCGMSVKKKLLRHEGISLFKGRIKQRS